MVNISDPDDVWILSKTHHPFDRLFSYVKSQKMKCFCRCRRRRPWTENWQGQGTPHKHQYQSRRAILLKKISNGKFTLTSTSQKCSTHDDHRHIHSNFGWYHQATSSHLSYRVWQRPRQARYIPTFILAHNAWQYGNVNSLGPQSHNVCRTAPWDDHKPHCCQKIIAQWLNDKKLL